MEDFDRRYIWAGLAIAGLILMLVGGFVFVDNQRKAQLAEEKVAELAVACDSAASDLAAHSAEAEKSWREVQQAEAGKDQFQLGDLNSVSVSGQEWLIRQIDVICNWRLSDLRIRLDQGRDLVSVYDETEVWITDLSENVNRPMVELQQAKDAEGALEAVESYGYFNVKPRVDYPPPDAVNISMARKFLNEGFNRVHLGWNYMADSNWVSANGEAVLANTYFSSAYDMASSPTPTPEPTNTPWPTNTPEPYNPPPTSSYDWSSDDSSDSSSWDSGSDSGSWDSGGSDSGSWDSGSDSGSWDSGGSDSGSWDSGGSDSGSWKVAPRLTPQPTHVIK